MTNTVTFVTGNQNKLAEAQAILSFDLKNTKLDLVEIQSMNVREVVRYKLREAYKILSSPVLVDDVSAELESLNGLPGPFIKFVEERLGAGGLYALSKVANDRVKIICCLGYYDGEREVIVDGIVSGTIVSPRGKTGWGFDKVVMPDGYKQTWGEMSPEAKNKTSHRFAALTLMAEKLKILS